MTSKQRVLEVFPDAKAVWRTFGGNLPRFPRSMIRSAPRHHFLRKKYARYLKGKWHFVVILIPGVSSGTHRPISVASSEVAAWQKAAEWYCVELTKRGSDV